MCSRSSNSCWASRGAGEGNSGYVRGGGPDQNLVLVDDAVVYNASHLFGFFSVFNPDAVKDIEVTKGTMPARFGGRVSSVLDIGLKEGNARRSVVSAASDSSVPASPWSTPGGHGELHHKWPSTYIDVLAKPFVNPESALPGRAITSTTNAKVNSRASRKNQFT